MSDESGTGARAGERAEAAQRGLTRFFAAPVIGMHNAWPPSVLADVEFNYWWLAHAIDARVDGFERTGDLWYVEDAERIYRAVRIRNGGRLFNGYFDDMMWLGCALARLGEHIGDPYLARADALWRRAVDRGWNARHGASLAWRTRQLDYKNAPANGPFAILGARLERLRPAGREELARTAFDWMHVRLRDDATGFVADGIGREGGSARDDWAFSYNHGVYVGAALALHRVRPDERLIAHATRTALDAIDRLAPDGVFVDQGAGDGALFAGVWYRYAAELLAVTDEERIRAFIRSSVDTLWRVGDTDGSVLAGPRWDRPAGHRVTLSAQLTAVFASEAAARVQPVAARS